MNHPLIGQLRAEAAGLPEDRVEQLVCVLKNALDAHEAEQAQQRARQDWNILCKAAYLDIIESEGLKADAISAEAGLDKRRKNYDDESSMARDRLERAMAEAGIRGMSRPALDAITRIFAETGPYSVFAFRVSVDASGEIRVEKREGEHLTIGDMGAALHSVTAQINWMDKPALRAAAAQHLGEAVQKMASASDFAKNLERAMDRQIFQGIDTGQLQGSITLGHIDHMLGQFISPPSFRDILADLPAQTDYHHTPIQVGQGTGQPPRALDIPSVGVPPDGAAAAQIRGGTAYINRQGKIIRIDYD